jgi:hypothetical protein
MSNEIIPTKEKQNFGGNIYYLNDEGDLVIEHVSGQILKMMKDGSTVVIDKSGDVVHQAVSGQSFNLDKKDGANF